MATDSKPTIPDDLIDQLLAGYSSPEDLTGKDGILKKVTARLVERALQGEMSSHLGYDTGDAPRGRVAGGNSRNGTSTKTLKTELDLERRSPTSRARSRSRRRRAARVRRFRNQPFHVSTS